jgi:hypothetical protein
MSVPLAVGEINLGIAFQVTINTPALFAAIGKQLEQLKRNVVSQGLIPDGQWDEAIKYFKTFDVRLDVSLNRANRAVAVMSYHDIQGAWNTQSLAAGWLPLTAEYLASKIAIGLDRRTLIATRDALESLGYQHGAGLEVRVGVTAQSEQGEAYMLVQEFGSQDGRVPARALVGPVLDENLNRYARVYADAIEYVLRGDTYPDFTRGVLA